MAIESEETTARLRERVTSPNGTTAAALKVLEEAKLRTAVERAVDAATVRGRQLSAQFAASE
jgi:pyrroline-5-carboxylate reductase